MSFELRGTCLKNPGSETHNCLPNRLVKMFNFQIGLNKLTVMITSAIILTGCNKPSDTKSTAMSDSIKTIVTDSVFGVDRPFLQCHASTLVRADNHDFLVAWFGGTHEKHDDVGIWLSTGRPGKWSAPIEVAKLREDPHWNPVLFKTPEGKIILYFKVGKTIDQWETWYMTTDDHGKTWTQAQELVPGDSGGRGPVKNKLIVLSDGTWLAPASDEKNGVWNAFVDRSSDQGKTWTASKFLTISRDSIPGEGIIQPTLWESASGKVHMLLRSSSGFICRSDSEDYGKTWSPVYKTSLPNPNSGIDLTKLDDGTLALAYNRDGKNWGARRPLSVAVSRDNGKTWPTSVDIETRNEGDEFSYPSIIGFGDTLAVSYTWKRQRISIWLGKVD
jgi:predicted neuraminidase